MPPFVANLQIDVNGTPLSPAVMQDVQSVTVNDDLRMASTFAIKLNSWNARTLEVTWADDRLFAIGNQVEIRPGYVNDTLRSVILGQITDLEVEYAQGQPPLLSVTGYDLRHTLALASACKTYNDMKDSDVASEVIGRNSLSMSVSPSTVSYAHTSQNNETDLAFLNRLAWRNCYDLTVDRDVIRFAPPSIFGAPVPLTMYQDLTQFTASVTSSMLVDQIQIAGRDVTNNQPFVVTTAITRFAGTLPFDDIVADPEPVSDLAVATQAEAEALGAAKGYDALLASLSGSGSGYGNNRLRAGMTVRIAGLGDRFGGSDYRLWNVTHSFSPDGYTTSFRVKGVPR